MLLEIQLDSSASSRLTNLQERCFEVLGDSWKILSEETRKELVKLGDCRASIRVKIFEIEADISRAKNEEIKTKYKECQSENASMKRKLDDLRAEGKHFKPLKAKIV